MAKDFWTDARARDAGISTSFCGRLFRTFVAFCRRVNFKPKRVHLHRSKYNIYTSREGDQIVLKFRTISLILDFRILEVTDVLLTVVVVSVVDEKVVDE